VGQSEPRLWAHLTHAPLIEEQSRIATIGLVFVSSQNNGEKSI
jgi:hypothetical protein